MHDGQETQWLVISAETFSSSSSSTANPGTRSWRDDVVLTFGAGRSLTFSRSSEAPDALKLSFGTPESFDLGTGRVFLLEGTNIRQYALELPPPTTQDSLKTVMRQVLETNGPYEWYRWDLSRGRVFYIEYGKLEFTPAIYQVPVNVSPIATTKSLTKNATNINEWMASASGAQRWEQTRVLEKDDAYKAGMPLDDAAEEIHWGEPNEIGLRLGLGGISDPASVPLGQILPVKQFIRNDGRESVKLSVTGFFGEGVAGTLLDDAGAKIRLKNLYPYPMMAHRLQLQPGRYFKLQTGGIQVALANPDGSSTTPLPRFGTLFVARPGTFSMQLSHTVGQFIGRPANTYLGDVRLAPGLGEWTGILNAAPIVLKIVDPLIESAKPGDVREEARTYRLEFQNDQIVLKLPITKRKSRNDDRPFPKVGGTWKIQNPAGEYLAAWDKGGRRLWVLDGQSIQKLDFLTRLTDAGRWPFSAAGGSLGQMPAGVRQVLHLPKRKEATTVPGLSIRGVNLAAVASTSNRLNVPDLYQADPDKPGEFRKSAKVFEMHLGGEEGNPVLKVPKSGARYYIELSDKIYGPIPGDPVVDLRLVELVRKELAPVPSAEGLKILESMITDGSPRVPNPWRPSGSSRPI